MYDLRHLRLYDASNAAAAWLDGSYNVTDDIVTVLHHYGRTINAANDCMTLPPTPQLGKMAVTLSATSDIVTVLHHYGRTINAANVCMTFPPTPQLGKMAVTMSPTTL